MIEQAAFAVAAALQVSDLSQTAKSSAIGRDIRRCVWTVARANGVGVPELARQSIAGETWPPRAIVAALRRPYVLRDVDWPAMEALAERSMYPGKRDVPRPTLDDVIGGYLRELAERSPSLAALAREAGLSRHAAKRWLTKYAVDLPGRAGRDGR